MAAMACSITLSSSFLVSHTTRLRFRSPTNLSISSTRRPVSLSVSASSSLQALIFDCDGVILESEHLHRQAYNEAFAHFNVRCSSQPLNWAPDFYDQLQNQIGGGKPKMRWSLSLFPSSFCLFFWQIWNFGYIFCLLNWGFELLRYFKEHGWPSSTIFEKPPEDDEDRAKIIDTLQVSIVLLLTVPLVRILNTIIYEIQDLFLHLFVFLVLSFCNLRQLTA